MLTRRFEGYCPIGHGKKDDSLNALLCPECGKRLAFQTSLYEFAVGGVR